MIDFLLKDRFDKLDLVYFIFTILFSIIGITFYLFNVFSVLVVCLILVNILFVIKFYNKIPLFILFVYIFLHSKVFAQFFIWKLSISFWQDFQTNSALGTVLISHLLFILTLGNSVSCKKTINEFNFLTFVKPNSKIFTILFFASIFILVFGIQGDNVFQRGSYADFDLVEKSTLHEYFILIFLFLILYSPPGIVYKTIIHCFLAFYVLKTLIYGGRIEVVQVCLLFFYLYYVLNGKVKSSLIVFLLIFGVYFNGLVSNIRSNPQIILTENYFDLINPINVFDLDSENENLSSMEGDVVQSSARVVGLIDGGQISLTQRILSLFSFLASPIVPQSLLPDYTNLAVYKQDIYKSGGGGLISTFFFTWLGYLGPIIAGSLIGLSIRKFYEFTSASFFIYGLCVLTMFPRWFSYNPIFLIKFSLYAVLLLYILKLISPFFEKSKKNEPAK